MKIRSMYGKPELLDCVQVEFTLPQLNTLAYILEHVVKHCMIEDKETGDFNGEIGDSIVPLRSTEFLHLESVLQKLNSSFTERYI